MKLKVGDKLLCKTESIVAGGQKLKNFYTKDKYYEIVDFLGYDCEIVVIENDLVGVVQSPSNVFFQDEIPLNFYTKVELRKLKLNNIEKNKK